MSYNRTSPHKKNELQSGEERKTSDCSSLLVQLFSYAVIRSITRRWYFQRSALRDARTDSSCAITIGFSRRSVRRVVFGLPTVHECGLDGIPVAGALRVLEEGGTELVLPLFGRHHGEVPRDCGLVRILIFNSGLHQRIVGLDIAEGLERSGEAHGAGQGLDAGLAGDDPLQEVLGGLLIGVGSLGVNAPVVLGASGQTLVLLALDARVDREHAEVPF